MDIQAKQVFQEFLLRQINEAKHMYERVTACQCEYFGGKDCACIHGQGYRNNFDDVDGQQIAVNGLRQEKGVVKYSS